MDMKTLAMEKEIANSYKVEKALKDKLNSEIETEEEIRNSCESIANKLLVNPKVKEVINGKPYLITLKVLPMNVKKVHVTDKTKVIEVPEDHVLLIIADINKYNLTGGKYLPFTAKGKVDKRYSLKDNIKTVVEGFIRHITGNIKPESLD